MLDQIPSEHGDHMIMLSMTKKKPHPKQSSLLIETNYDFGKDDQKLRSLKPSYDHDFALNYQINCSGKINPDRILESQMPWEIDESERIL